MDMHNVHKCVIEFGKNSLSLTTGKHAKQAAGAVWLEAGETTLLATACGGKEAIGADFLPFSVHYNEKLSSAGMIPGGYFRREGKPSEAETIICRLIDRPLRPLFPAGLFTEIQILATLFSYDAANLPDPYAIIASSAALLISDLPFDKAVAAVRIGRLHGKWVVNPSYKELQQSELDLIVAGTKDHILMIEGFADLIEEEDMVEAIELAHSHISTICVKMEEWANQVGKEKKTPLLVQPSEQILTTLKNQFKDSIQEAFKIKSKKERDLRLSLLRAEMKSMMPIASDLSDEQKKIAKLEISIALEETEAFAYREFVLRHGSRPDGRAVDQVRKITIEQGPLPKTHGSSLFTRGETQALAVCTLASEDRAQKFESLEGDQLQKFLLHYNFPPYSVGETGRMAGPGRREIGHGNLAFRALRSIIPAFETFPYTLRVESTILESNGSSSMATVCGSTLAMMDAGVPIRQIIAGIAMGLITDGEHFVVLSDIAGHEDSLGDMDFKVAGDGSRITAFQLDIKIGGLTFEMIRKALAQAKQGIVHILGIMKESCPAPRKQISPHAPQVEVVQISPSKIGALIGPGGKNIKQIIESTGAEISVNDAGQVSISAKSKTAMDAARAAVEDMTSEIEVNKVYTGKVASIREFGAFVTLPGKKDGLLHISEIDHERINEKEIEKYFKVNDMIEVKVLEISRDGKIRLSRKVLLEPKKRSSSDETASSPKGDEKRPRAQILPPPDLVT